MIGVRVGAKIIINGVLTGDWEGAAEEDVGSQGTVHSYRFGVLPADGKLTDDDDPSLDPARGQLGGDGSRGLTEGANLWGQGGLYRTSAADGASNPAVVFPNRCNR